MSPILLLGGVAVLLLAFSGKDEKKGGTGGTGTGTGDIPPGFADCLDDNMPPALKQSTIEALQNPNMSAEALEALADVAELAGFVKAAACLSARADEVSKTGGPPGPGGTGTTPPGIGGEDQPGGTTGFPGIDDIIDQFKDKFNIPTSVPPGTTSGVAKHAIRFGDSPYYLAKYYTGQGARFKELEPLNPQLGTLQTVNGVSNYPGWVPGAIITIPDSWGYFSKPLPVPGTQNPSGITPSPGVVV